ncbi:hypothetical protein [Streptomyces tropicalis]|uniref:Secreted protein n=1 Tax=Streptomyces tropicalis TaxID=3034234 RepID=A0ABT6A3G7_9ACTN|nr:hypothetical protein [Streptomyces tropicalis]MDF3299177.1 hypothetical protein [Streptomyces tropicalis]
MRTTRTFCRPGTAVALTALLATGLGAGVAGASPARPAAHAVPAQTRQIASAVLGGDYRITLTAVRSADDEYAASVRLRVYRYTGGAWKESDRATVGGPDAWFWYPLTGGGAVCRFSTASTGRAPVEVSLLVTPSLGCSPTHHYVVEDGHILAG